MKRFAVATAAAIVLLFIVFANTCGCTYNTKVGPITETRAVPPDNREKICLGSAEFYTDETFSERAPDDDELVKKAREKMDKYLEVVREKMGEKLKEHEVDMVRCARHAKKNEGEGGKEGGEEEGKTLHMKMGLAYYIGVATVTIYVKIWVYDGDDLLFDFPAKISASGVVASNKEKRTEALNKFGGELAETIAKKIKEKREEKK